MFHKTIDALKAAEVAAQEELDSLFVPYNPEDGTGGVHWHAAGSGILQNALRGLTGLREELEKRQVPIDEATAAAEKAQAEADAAAKDQAEREAAAAAETPAEEVTETPAEEAGETAPVNPTPVAEVPA